MWKQYCTKHWRKKKYTNSYQKTFMKKCVCVCVCWWGELVGCAFRVSPPGWGWPQHFIHVACDMIAWCSLKQLLFADVSTESEALMNKCGILFGCVWNRKSSYFLLDYCVLGRELCVLICKKLIAKLKTCAKAEN